jgi:hypothetical protein
MSWEKRAFGDWGGRNEVSSLPVHLQCVIVVEVSSHKIYEPEDARSDEEVLIIHIFHSPLI